MIKNKHRCIVTALLVLGIGSVTCGSSASAEAVTRVYRDRPMQKDAATMGLWRVDDVKGRTLADLSGHNRPAKLDGAKVVDVGYVLPGFNKAADMKSGGKIVADKGGAPVGKGPFSIEMRMRLRGRGGKLLTVGKGYGHTLTWALLCRGAGHADLWAPVRMKDGSVKTVHRHTWQFFKAAGDEQFSKFDHYALTYDGKRTFRIYVNGSVAWKTQLPKGAAGLAVDNPLLKLGDAMSWKSDFAGQIAEARVSSKARQFKPAARDLPASLKGMGPVYGFDFGKPDSPVATHDLRVSPVTPVYSVEQGYGWDHKPTGAGDYWFSPGRYRPQPALALKHHKEGVRSRLKRDHVTVNDGATFRADIPAGRYAVRVVLGNLRKNVAVSGVVVNGTRIGDSKRSEKGGGSSKPVALRTAINDVAEGDTVTVRGVVNVGANGLRVQVKGLHGQLLHWMGRKPDEPRDKGIHGQPVSVMGIEAQPWAPPVIQRGKKDRQLVWAGEGSAPAGFQQAAAAFADKDFKKAVKLAEKIDDPLARATMWAWVLGYPDSTKPWHVQLAQRIEKTVGPIVHKHPNNAAARALLSATKLFYPVLREQMDEGRGVDGLFGENPARWLYDAGMRALEITPAEPYYGRAQLLGGTLLYQRAQQSGGLVGPFQFSNPERFPAMPFPRTYFSAAHKAWPDAALASIYSGVKVPLKKQIAIPQGTPPWAAIQHRALVRMMDVIHYWTDQRQNDRGLLSGGLGDDVEALRWWSIGHLVADDQRTREGWRKLARTAWKMTDGCGFWHKNIVSDVEHGSEPIADTLTFLPFINFGTDQFKKTLAHQYVVFKNVRDVWTGINPQGYRMFRAYHMSATKVRKSDNADTYYNVRATNPAMFYAWFTRDPAVSKLIVNWAKSWRDAILASGQGKPAGIWPDIVTFDKRRFTKKNTDKPWYDIYYGYPGGNRVYNVLLAAYDMTGKQSFVDPQRKVLKLMRTFMHEHPKADFNPEAHQSSTATKVGSRYRPQRSSQTKSKYKKGSLDWALGSAVAGVGELGARYRNDTGDTQFDDVLKKIAPPTTRARIGIDQAKTPAQRRGALKPINDFLKRVLGRLDYNWPLRTSEPKGTDRVWVPGTEAVIAMATGTATRGGARGSERYWPLFGVSWKNTGTRVSMFITDNTQKRLAGYLYNFDAKTREVGAQIWRLKPATYTLRIREAKSFGVRHGKKWIERQVTIKKRGDIIHFKLPGRRQVRFTFE